MKALQYATYGSPAVLHLAERPVPEPGAADVVVRVHAAPVGPGDCKTRAGLLRQFHEVTFPKVPGRYGSGVIAKAGAHAGWNTGDAVVFATIHSQDGSAAEYVRIPAAKVAAKPQHMSHTETAAMIQGATCAYVLLAETARLARGESVLIHGAAGAVGSACVELARHLGVDVTAVCRETDRDFVGALGADRVIAFDREDFAATARDQDVVVDLIGGEVHRRSYDALKKGGRLVYLHADPIENQGERFGVEVRNAAVDDRGALLDAVCRLADQGVFKPRVGKALPLAEGAQAHRLVESNAIKRGRVVLDMP